MAPFRGIATALDAKFPKPRVDSEWLEQCCSWVVEEKELSVTGNFEEFFEIVLQQLLNSDLKDSMQHGTGLPEVSCFTGNLSGPPVLVQIMAIKDMGISAFQLEQIRAAREERILAGVGNEEGDEDGDVEVEGEGPMPKYPRGTLLLRLSDGATEFEAMEYRPIPQLVLGVTELGYKLQLNGTRFSNGMAFLEPATIRLIGGLNAELNDEWEENFKQYLQARLMGQAAETQGEFRTTPHPDLPRLSRAPLRDISPPPATLHDDDVDMEPRRKKPISISHEQNIATSSNPRSIKSLPNRLRKSGEMRENDIKVEAKLEDSPPLQWETFPKRSLPYRDTSVISVGNSVPHKSSGRGEQTSFDFDLLDEVDGSENALPKPSRHKGKGRAIYDSPQKRHPPGGYSSDYGIDEVEDENFWEVLDRVEKKALDGERPNTQSKSNIDSGDGRSQRLSTGPATPPLASGNDVIELDSDEDANKENAFVPMRHVRRKTEELVRGRSPTTAQRQKPTRKKKKATLSTPCEVIDISDSD